MGVHGTIPEGGGLRERNKRDKLARIVAAAREAFGRNGFDGTTLREVAAAAGVGTGTLFLYARTKEDLLVLVFRRELEPIIDGGFDNVPDADLATQLEHVFHPITEHHSKNLVLSRPFIKDLTFVSDDHALEVADFMQRWLKRIVAVVEAAQARGEVRGEIDAALLASCSRQMFLSGLRRYVAGRMTRESFEAELRRSLDLLLMGTGPAGG